MSSDPNIRRVINQINFQKNINFSRKVKEVKFQNQKKEEEKITSKIPEKMTPESLFQHSSLLKSNNRKFK